LHTVTPSKYYFQ